PIAPSVRLPIWRCCCAENCTASFARIRGRSSISILIVPITPQAIGCRRDDLIRVGSNGLGCTINWSNTLSPSPKNGPRGCPQQTTKPCPDRLLYVNYATKFPVV